MTENNSPYPTRANESQRVFPYMAGIFELGQQCSTALRQSAGWGFDSLAAHKPSPSLGILRSDHRAAASDPLAQRSSTRLDADPLLSGTERTPVRAAHLGDATGRSPTKSAQEAGRHLRRRGTARRVHRRFASVPDDRARLPLP